MSDYEWIKETLKDLIRDYSHMEVTTVRDAIEKSIFKWEIIKSMEDEGIEELVIYDDEYNEGKYPFSKDTVCGFCDFYTLCLSCPVEKFCNDIGRDFYSPDEIIERLLDMRADLD